MRFRSTLILAVLFLALGAYLYFVEAERARQEGKKEKLYHFTPDEVVALTLTYQDRTIRLKRVDEAWRLTAPVDAKADDTAVKNLVRAIADCEIKKTLSDVPEDLEPFGLEPPFVEVHVKLKDRELPVLRVGKTTPVGFSTYVQRADRPKIYLTGSAFHAGMDKQVKDLRDKRIITFEDAAVRRIALAAPNHEIELWRQDGQWRIARPRPYRADETTVRSFLATLRSMRATDFPAEKAEDLAPYGLDHPRLKVTVFVGEHEEPKVVLLGKEEEGKVYVKRAVQPTIYQVRNWVYRDLDKSVNDFRDKTLLHFEKAAVRKLILERPGAPALAFARADGKGWRLAAGSGAVRSDKIDELLSDLHSLKGYEIAADSVTDLGRYGLEPPRLTIRLVDEKGKPIGAVRLGSYTPKPPQTEYTAFREGTGTVFHIREYQFNRLNKRRADLLVLPTATPTHTPAPNLRQTTPAPRAATATPGS